MHFRRLNCCECTFLEVRYSDVCNSIKYWKLFYIFIFNVMEQSLVFNLLKLKKIFFSSVSGQLLGSVLTSRNFGKMLSLRRVLKNSHRFFSVSFKQLIYMYMSSCPHYSNKWFPTKGIFVATYYYTKPKNLHNCLSKLLNRYL